MTGDSSETTTESASHRLIQSRLFWFAVGVIGAVGLFLLGDRLNAVGGDRLWADWHDIDVYFDRGGWVPWVDGEFRAPIVSQYPAAATLLFGTVRVVHGAVTGFATSSVESFRLLWVIGSWFMYVTCLALVARKIRVSALWLWLTPAALYFSLFRYDIIPVAATLIALLYVRDDRHVPAAIWFGVAVALKGYVLFAMPAYIVYVWCREGVRTAVTTSVLVALPFVATTGLVLALDGVDAMMEPFRTQSTRGPNGESTFDAVTYLFGSTWEDPATNGLAWLPRGAQLLQISFAVAAAAFRPRTFDRLIDAMLVAVLGFTVASIFNSPQFVLWYLPFVSFSTSASLRWGYTALGWLTYVYFPVTFRKPGFEIAVVANSVLRLGLLIASVTRLVKTEPGET